MAQEIYLIDDGNELKNKLVELFKNEKDYKFKKAKTTQIENVLKHVFTSKNMLRNIIC